MRGHYFVAGDPGVVSAHHGSPLLVLLANIFAEYEATLVLVAVLELSARMNAYDPTLGALDAKSRLVTLKRKYPTTTKSLPINLVHRVLVF